MNVSPLFTAAKRILGEKAVAGWMASAPLAWAALMIFGTSRYLRGRDGLIGTASSAAASGEQRLSVCLNTQRPKGSASRGMFS
jgi:hypothetical protein